MEVIYINEKPIENCYRLIGHSSGIRTIIEWNNLIFSGSDDKSIKVSFVTVIFCRSGKLILGSVLKHLLVIQKEFYACVFGGASLLVRELILQ